MREREGNAKAAKEIKNGVVFRRSKTESEASNTGGVTKSGVVLRRSKTVGGAEDIDGKEIATKQQNRIVRVVESIEEDSGTNDGVVMRQTKNLRGQRNRKSALHGDDIPFDSVDSTSGMLGDVNVKIISVSPEHKKKEEGVVIESRTGTVFDLVKEFDQKEVEHREDGAGLPDRNIHHGQRSLAGEEERENVTQPGSADGGTDHDKKKPKHKAFDMFEKSGIVMGMVST